MDSITVCLTFIYYPAPSLTAYPSQVIYRGGSLTFLCYSDVPRLTLSLCRDCNTYPQIIESKIPDTDVAEFNIKNLKYEHGGDYCCFVRAQSSSSPYSNILRIEVTDLKKPEISWKKHDAEKGVNIITCTAPELHEDYTIKYFSLYENMNPVSNYNAEQNVLKMTFTQCVNDLSYYRCVYVINAKRSSDYQIKSPVSESLQTNKDGEDDKFIVEDSEDDTFIAKDLRRPRDRIPRYVRPVSMATPRSNRSSPPLPLTLLECRQEDSGTEEEVPDIQDDPVPGDVAEPPLSPAGAEEEVARVEYGEDDKFIAKDYLIPVIAAVCSILLLIFVGVIVFYIVRKSNRAKEKLHCSQIPLEDKVPHAKEPTYCSVDENISREKPDVPMERQEEDVKDADVVTYAVLNKEALNKNRKSLDTKLEDSSFYAEVRK
ncbi:uncharacterized protein LOC128638648 isoform X2 [Bombina bombina]|uniref:uncharacterized protein LOC128638648 isoform X2 n=1 Tax=Bombina bombina TaxID=8345 RepID=UPI00235B2B1D|nr:uncharacterized protein LOC128638648 isoform X2 [Bombina bombina]